MESILSAPTSAWHWLRSNPGSWPSVVALAAVAVFWIVGLLGGLSVLHYAQSPMVTLVGLYVMLIGVVVSITVAVIAAKDLGHRLATRRRSYRRV